MHAFVVLSDPIRRRILELLADGEMTSGAIGVTVQEEFGISQPAVSQHLRESGFATVRPEGTRRLYAVQPDSLRDLEMWLDRFRRFWTPPLEALATELARGKRQNRRRADADTDLRLHGRYQLEGNAGGTIQRCDPTERLRRNVGVRRRWSLMGLALHLASRRSVDPREVAAWSGSAEGTQFMSLSSQRWCEASVAAGTNQADARAAADRTTAAYTGGPPTS